MQQTTTHWRGAAAAAVVAWASLLATMAYALDRPPVAPVRPVVDNYFGTEVVDNYRYMENLGDPQVQSWMKSQADYTRATLGGLPGRAKLLGRIHELSNADVDRNSIIRRGQRYFYRVVEPGAQVPKLYYRDGLQGTEHLLLDPAGLERAATTSTTSTTSATPTTHYSLDYFMPSWDGRHVAYGISAGGSEKSVLHVLEVDSGKVLGEAIDRTSDAVIAWRPDNRSFFYLRYPETKPDTPPAETQYNARTYLHTLGKHTAGDGDPVVFGRGVSKTVDVPEGQATYVVLSPDSAYAVAVANHNMDANPTTLYVAPLAKATDSKTPWRKLADVADGVTQFELRGDTLYFLSQHEAPRYRLLSTSLKRPDVGHAKVIIPEGRGVITEFAFAQDRLYVRRRDGATSHLLESSADGGKSRPIPLPFEGNVADLVTDSREPGVLFRLQGWVQAPRVLEYAPSMSAPRDTGLVPASKVDLSHLETEEVHAVSYDGTRIPLSIVHKKGIARDGSHPAILNGYGSYGNSLEPRFSRANLAWIERGGVIAIAHLRGGGEYGEAWHRAGQKLTKINTILDFIACGQYLVDQKYSSPKYLAGIGGSAGGVPVGGALTWRPDLFSVILDVVGMSDTLRFETEPNGPPNVPEFGSVRTEDGFHGLYAMGAYNHIRTGVAYPAVIFSTGANDPRVAPWHMMKMAARVQATTSSSRPVLLRVDYDAGHGIGSTTSQREAQLADFWSFALWQMGDPEFQPAARP